MNTLDPSRRVAFVFVFVFFNPNPYVLISRSEALFSAFKET